MALAMLSPLSKFDKGNPWNASPPSNMNVGSCSFLIVSNFAIPIERSPSSLSLPCISLVCIIEIDSNEVSVAGCSVEGSSIEAASDDVTSVDNASVVDDSVVACSTVGDSVEGAASIVLNGIINVKITIRLKSNVDFNKDCFIMNYPP